MELAYLDDYASLVPFVWVRASLVLDPHSVTYLSWYVHSISLGDSLNASSRNCRYSLHVVCGLYFPGRMGMRSLTGLPNMHIAGDIFVGRVWGVPVLEDRCLECIEVDGTILPNIASDQSFLTVLTPTSALQLLCGKATELRRWCTPIGVEIPWLRGIRTQVCRLMTVRLGCRRWQRCVVGF